MNSLEMFRDAIQPPDHAWVTPVTDTPGGTLVTTVQSFCITTEAIRNSAVNGVIPRISDSHALVMYPVVEQRFLQICQPDFHRQAQPQIIILHIDLTHEAVVACGEDGGTSEHHGGMRHHAARQKPVDDVIMLSWKVRSGIERRPFGVNLDD